MFPVRVVAAITAVTNTPWTAPESLIQNPVPGPTDELSQTLTYKVSVAKADLVLFSVSPALDASGILTFRPKATAAAVTININVIDNGTPPATNSQQVVIHIVN